MTKKVDNFLVVDKYLFFLPEAMLPDAGCQRQTTGRVQEGEIFFNVHVRVNLGHIWHILCLLQQVRLKEQNQS